MQVPLQTRSVPSLLSELTDWVRWLISSESWELHRLDLANLVKHDFTLREDCIKLLLDFVLIVFGRLQSVGDLL